MSRTEAAWHAENNVKFATKVSRARQPMHSALGGMRLKMAFLLLPLEPYSEL